MKRSYADDHACPSIAVPLPEIETWPNRDATLAASTQEVEPPRPRGATAAAEPFFPFQARLLRPARYSAVDRFPSPGEEE
ncbi:MAG: hypothetical protein ACRD22_05440, partial [Terriglobia bacterium]